MSRLAERIYPVLAGLIGAAGILWFNLGLSSVKKLDAILNSAITVSSIIIGFLAAMVSVLISISGKRIMKRIREKGAESLLTWYIREAIISGFIVAVFSTILYMFVDYDGKSSVYLLATWTFLITYFVLCSYRIINVMMNILAAIPEEYAEDSQSSTYVPDKTKAFTKQQKQ